MMAVGLRQTVRVSIAALALGVLSPTMIAAASVDDEPSAPVKVSVPLVAAGYDSVTAQENGFKLVTGSDGKTVSAPITPEAKRKLAQESPLNGAFETVQGECGAAHLYIGTPSRGEIQIDTGFTVPHRVVKREWAVSGGVRSGTFYERFNGSLSGSTWSSSRRLKVGDSSSGFGSATGRVVMWTGKVCASLIPTDEW